MTEQREKEDLRELKEERDAIFHSMQRGISLLNEQKAEIDRLREREKNLLELNEDKIMRLGKQAIKYDKILKPLATDNEALLKRISEIEAELEGAYAERDYYRTAVVRLQDKINNGNISRAGFIPIRYRQTEEKIKELEAGGT